MINMVLYLIDAIFFSFIRFQKQHRRTSQKQIAKPLEVLEAQTNDTIQSVIITLIMH